MRKVLILLFTLWATLASAQQFQKSVHDNDYFPIVPPGGVPAIIQTFVTAKQLSQYISSSGNFANAPINTNITSLNGAVQFVPTSPASTLGSPYNFYDTFSGTLGPFVNGRQPDSVSNGNSWVVTGGSVTNMQVGNNTYSLSSLTGGQPAYAVMHTTCAGAPSEVGGTFQSSNVFTPTIASVFNYATYGFNNMVHPNPTIPTGGGSGSITTGLWSSNPPNSSTFAGQAAKWTEFANNALGNFLVNTKYNYREFYNGNYVNVRMENAATGVVVGEWSSYDPLISTLDGPDVFFELFDTTTVWSAAWARCATTSNTQTNSKINGGLAGTPIGVGGDTADAQVSSLEVGFNATIGSVAFRQGVEQCWVGGAAQDCEVVGQGTNGLFIIGSDTSGQNGIFEIFNGAAFPTRAANGMFQLYEDGSYNTNFVSSGVNWLRYIFNGIPAWLVPVALAGNYSAAGTPLPTCNSTYKGAMAYVSDALSPTYNGSYTSGGAVSVPVFCSGTAPWTTH